MDGLREKRISSEVCKVKNRIVKLRTVNGGLELQTSKYRHIVRDQQKISCYLKMEANISIHFKPMAHLLKDCWSRRVKGCIVKLINQTLANLRS